MVENAIVQGDCFELFKDLPDASVDLVVTDPPYGLTDQGNMESFVNGKPTTSDWDWDSMSFQAYEEFASKYLREISRVLKQGRWAYVWCGDFWPGLLRKYGFEYDLKAKCMLIAKKRNASPSWRKMNWRINYEFCTAFSKGPSSKKDFHFLGQREMLAFQQFEMSDDQRLIEVDFPVGRKDTIHPTEKPESLMSLLILASSDEGELVLDPFVGSGTTCVAAKKLGRRFLGFEKNPEYVMYAKERIAQVLPMGGDRGKSQEPVLFA